MTVSREKLVQDKDHIWFFLPIVYFFTFCPKSGFLFTGICGSQHVYNMWTWQLAVSTLKICGQGSELT